MHVTHADIGGQRGHGRVIDERGHGRVIDEHGPEPEGELWHAAWEPRVLALTLAMGASGQWNIDLSRAARESLPDYARLGYYEIWLHALEALLAERGLVSGDEIVQGRMLHPPLPLPLSRVLRAADVPTLLARGAPTERRSDAAPRFAPGDVVRTWAGDVPHPTRLPRYARGKRGQVVAHHGAHVFADAHASGRGEMPCHLYSVVFAGHELWGNEAETDGLSVSIDAWEPYLQPEPHSA